MLIHEQKIAFFKDNMVAVNDMSGRALTHIDEFNIIVGMLREMNESGMRAHVNEFAISQNQRCVYLIGPVPAAC
jgi:hypothetical protein